ncbi:MAG: glycosyltransferase [Chloroflexi bacterium]|nr:MAG: glycosyltransferase [Chloroflexota bacterium]
MAPADARLPISVVVPARNAAEFIDACLAAVQRNNPAEIIVVDGRSDDETVEIAGHYADSVLSDEGGGVAYARQMGAEVARQPYVAFVDVDIELTDTALRDLLDELKDRKLEAIQAQLRSVGGQDYWSRALVSHHRGGRSKHWFGLVASVFVREAFLHYGMDSAFSSGEDIELRYRLEKSGARIGLSEEVVVPHRFGSGFNFALGQWLADGSGLGRVVRKFGWPAAATLLIPAGGTVLGIGRSLLRQPQFVAYYALYGACNYAGIVHGLLDKKVQRLKSVKQFEPYRDHS